MPESSKFLWAAERILRQYNHPMSASEIYDAARNQGFFPDDFKGKTPEQTMKSKLSQHILRHGDQSIFVRTRPGRFYLREFTDDEGIFPAPRWTPPATDEIVAVFPSALIGGKGSFQGLRTDVAELFDALFRSGQCFGLARTEAELTEEYKQIIAYVMVRRGNDFLAYRRGVYNRSADMLRGADCVGFGGHVSIDDGDLMSSDDAGILYAAARELAEELKLPDEDLDRLERGEGLGVVGIINDDSSPVGRKHLAVVLEYWVSDSSLWDNPERGEESITKLRWVGPETGALNLDDYEYWSKLCLREFSPELIKTQPSLRVKRRRAFKTPHLLVVAGEIGSGKTEVAQALVTRFGYELVNTGEIVAALIDRPKVTAETRLAFQAVAQRFISSPEGPARLASEIARAVKEIGADRILIDGIRHSSTLHRLKELKVRTRVGLLYVEATPDTAFSFYKQRERSTATMNDFLQVRESPVEKEVPNLFREADAVLFNWFGRAELIAALEGLPFKD